MKKSISILIIIVTILLCSCSAQNREYEGFDFFGTFYSFKGKIQSKEDNERILADVEYAISPINGEIASFNNLTKGETIVLSERAGELIEFAIDFYNNPLTEGKLDFTIYPLVKLWGFNADNDNDRIPPTDVEIESILNFIGLEGISYDRETRALTKLKEGVELDFGAYGKGYALDCLLKIENNVNGIFNLGGTVTVKGKNTKVGISSPLESSNSYFASFELADGKFVSTSGSYEKFFEYDGNTYHHILDNGYPVRNGLVSVTVIADSGLLADSLSTCCFILGEEKALALLDYYEASAVFVYDDYSVGVYKIGINLKASEYHLK